MHVLGYNGDKIVIGYFIEEKEAMISDHVDVLDPGTRELAYT